MEGDSVLQLLLHANRLKRIPRTGWMMRGVADVESVSDHTFGVAFVSLVLAHLMDRSIDIAKLLSMALIHDLPEAVLSDIPSPALRHISLDVKRAAEEEVLKTLVDELPQPETWQAWWRELAEQASLEAKIVHDADRIEMLIQALVYQETTGNRWLDEFWAEATPDGFELEVSRIVLEALCDARGRLGRRRELD